MYWLKRKSLWNQADRAKISGQFSLGACEAARSLEALPPCLRRFKDRGGVGACGQKRRLVKEGLLKSLIFCHGSLAQPDFGRLWPEKEPGQ